MNSELQEKIIENFILNRNAYFYQKTNNIPDYAITKLFREASAEKDGNYLVKTINENKTVNGKDCKVSMCLFKLKKEPTFLSEPLTEVKESSHGYVILFEYSSSLVMFRKNVIGTEKALRSYLCRVDYSTISRVFVNNLTAYEKFNTSNMNTADNAIRNSSIEAVNLKNIVNRFGASKKILNSMRIDNDGERHSLSLNTARINYLGEKIGLNNIYLWCLNTIDIIEAYSMTPAYIDIFSTPIKFEDFIDSIEPTNVLFKFTRLKDKFDNGEIVSQYICDEDENRVQIDVNTLVLSNFDLLCDLGEGTGNFNRTLYPVFNNYDPNMSIVVGKKFIRIKSPKFKEIFLEDTEGTTNTLEYYLNTYSDFIVNFTDPEIVYANRKLFRDHKLLSDIDGFMSVFDPIDLISSCTSEKGSFTNGQTQFEKGSLFRLIEDYIAEPDECLFCDDLGNEWADYIGIEGDKITFYHAKHRSVGMSATNFQDVVGQALKNLGNFEPSDDDIEHKKIAWSKNYNGGNAQTSIPRFVKGPSNNIDLAIDKYKFANSAPNRRKEVVLVIDFISHSQLRNNLLKLKAGQDFTRRKETLQILWQISALVANCVELGVGIRITCEP